MKKLDHEGVINMLKQSDAAYWDYIKHRTDMERVVNTILHLELTKRLLKTIKQDAKMALDGTWDRSDEGFKDQIELIDKLLKEIE